MAKSSKVVVTVKMLDAIRAILAKADPLSCKVLIDWEDSGCLYNGKGYTTHKRKNFVLECCPCEMNAQGECVGPKTPTINKDGTIDLGEPCCQFIAYGEWVDSGTACNPSQPFANSWKAARRGGGSGCGCGGEGGGGNEESAAHGKKHKKEKKDKKGKKNKK